MVPLNAQGQLPSIGAMKHAEGLCKPCLFFPMAIGCSSGITCQFCHMPHSRAMRRLCKSKRDRYKKLVECQVALRRNNEQIVASLDFQTVDDCM